MEFNRFVDGERQIYKIPMSSLVGIGADNTIYGPNILLTSEGHLDNPKTEIYLLASIEMEMSCRDFAQHSIWIVANEDGWLPVRVGVGFVATKGRLARDLTVGDRDYLMHDMRDLVINTFGSHACTSPVRSDQPSE